MTAPHPHLLTLLAGLAAVLVVASGIGYVLQWRLSPDGSNTVRGARGRELANAPLSVHG